MKRYYVENKHTRKRYHRLRNHPYSLFSREVVPLKISVIGIGYVGAVTGACLAELGHQIIFVGRDQNKLDLINSGKSPIFEQGLDQLLQKNQKRITTTIDLPKAIHKTDLTFICVGTPSKIDGSIDLEQIQDVSVAIGKCLRSEKKYHTIIVKSTVLPGTTESLVIPILEKESGKKAFVDWGVASNPEFLKEGTAIGDFFHTDRIVIGINDQKTKLIVEDLYKSINAPIFATTIRTSEMIKYTSNAFLATKISFANEIGNLCKKMGIDTKEVFDGVGMDQRIGPDFFRSGIGFGGSCFPKDVRALIAGAKKYCIDLSILESALTVNEKQPLKLMDLLGNYIPDLKGKTIGILGLAFKPDTDDIRDSRAIPLIEYLIQHGARVIAYDPLAMDNFRKLYPGIIYAVSAQETLKSDAVLIVTEWREFEDLDYTGKIVMDGRRVNAARTTAAIYEGVCW
jgi:UDPglucose 6-dehydrogenase